MIIRRDQPLANYHPSVRHPRHPHHPSHLCQDTDSISRTFLELFVLVYTKGEWLEVTFSFKFKVYGIEGGVKNVKRCQSNKKTIIVCDLPQMFVLAQRVASLCKIIEAL